MGLVSGAVADGRRCGGWEWPEWGDSGLPRPRTVRDRITQVVWPGFFLFYLIQPTTDALNGKHPVGVKATVLVLLVVFAVSYLFAATRRQLSHPRRVLLIGWLALFPITLALLLGPDYLTFFTYVISPALFILPRNVGILFGIGSAVATLLTTAIVEGNADWSGAMVLGVLTFSMVAFTRLLWTVRQLRATQEKMAKLAIAEERSRLARDLHDVLGHSLTTITVKAGLARRVLESSADRERAIVEVRDVEELARQALTEVRATVSGYRTASLPAELVGARAALQAAGITADLPMAVDDVPPELQETFAYVLREGVTNVIRHSGANRCAVRLGAQWLEVRDDGRASADAVAQSRDAGGGHGLSGLAERVGKVGGRLAAGPLPDGGFLLKVSVEAAVTRAETKAETRADATETQPVGHLTPEPPVGVT